jgi:hypothetical protein
MMNRRDKQKEPLFQQWLKLSFSSVSVTVESKRQAGKQASRQIRIVPA